MNTDEKLFSGFAPTTREQWKAKAMEDLKGSDFDKKLIWKTDDGFPVQPFYTHEDISDNEALKAQRNIFTQENRSWVNYTRVILDDPAKANALAVEMVSFGATGIIFQLQQEPNIDFDVLVQNLDPEQLNISFASADPSAALVSDYFNYLSRKNVRIENIKGFYGSDVLERWTTKGIEPDFDALYHVIRAAEPAPEFKALAIQSHAFINAGANTTQELAFTFNKLADYFEILQSKGLSAEVIASNLLLHFAIGGDYFFEIAKLRAARILSKSILQQYDVNVDVDIMSSNSIWSKSFYDPNVNMLRNTTEAMSAVLGGCDALLTYPHDSSYSQSSNFSHRVALNVSNLIKEESYFDKVVDPAGGSYYIESLTGILADHALQLFLEIEKAGGFTEAFKAGIIQQKIDTVREKKEQEIAMRKQVYVGTSKYPNSTEKAILNGTMKVESKDGLQLLVPQRATQSFDELRSKTLKHFEQKGFIPKVCLACFGNPATRKARASFSAEFFALAGFELVGEFNFTDILEGATESAASTADIIVLCSSDADYVTSALAFTKTFKLLSTGKLLVVAGNPEGIVERLQQAGVDAFIHIKSNAIELLSGFQKKLFANKP